MVECPKRTQVTGWLLSRESADQTRSPRPRIGFTRFLLRASWTGLCRASSAPLVSVSSTAVACSCPCLSCHPCLPCLLLFQRLLLEVWITARLIIRNRREPTLPQLQSGRVTAAELGFPVHSLTVQCKVSSCVSRRASSLLLIGPGLWLCRFPDSFFS